MRFSITPSEGARSSPSWMSRRTRAAAASLTAREAWAAATSSLRGPQFGQAQAFLRRLQLLPGLVQREPGAVRLLLGDEVLGHQVELAPVHRFRIRHRHPRGIPLGPGLADFLGAGTGQVASHHLALDAGLGLGLVEGQAQAFGIQARQQLALFHPVAFPHQDIGDAPAGVEGQFHLADVDVAVQGEFGQGRLGLVLVPPDSTGYGGGDEGKDQEDFRFHGASFAVSCSAARPLNSRSRWLCRWRSKSSPSGSKARKECFQRMPRTRGAITTRQA
jgi:hypothetical protein